MVKEKTSTKQKDPEQTAAANYIIQFYQEVNLLKQNYAIYVNALKELEAKQNQEQEINIEEAEKQQINKIVQTARYYLIQSHITCDNILTILNKKKEQEILQNLYNQVIKDYILDTTKLHAYVTQISLTLIQEAMRGLLKTSEDIIKGLYNDQ